jgi:hypothetical protein
MKKGKVVNILLIFIPFFWACFVDLILTTINQPTEYWYGNLQMVSEGNPLVEFLMKNSISGIFIFVSFWIPIIVIIGYYLPSKFLRVLVLFVVILHTYGASSWLAECCGFWTLITFVLLNSFMFILFEDIYRLRTLKI